MFSLPLIPPQPDLHALDFGASFQPLSDLPSVTNGSQNLQQHRQLQQRRDEERKLHNARSPLALLAADEAAIQQRKAAIRNFGAYWIRPPGITKTLHAMTEELVEQAEQEEMMRREQELRDMQAQQELDEVRERATAAAAIGDNEDAEERDLDDEIPEAEAEIFEDTTFNDESMLEGSQQDAFAMEEAELTGAARDEEELGIELDEERDLDDSIPEAGSYQHTDTELEDSLSDSELQDSFVRPAARRSLRSSTGRGSQVLLQSTALQTPEQHVSMDLSSSVASAGQQRIGLQRRSQAPSAHNAAAANQGGSHTLSSSILDSSFLDSSPVLRRGTTGRGAARRRGRGS